MCLHFVDVEVDATYEKKIRGRQNVVGTCSSARALVKITQEPGIKLQKAVFPGKIPFGASTHVLRHKELINMDQK